ncbi:hypothetical protein [Peribacillus loiseleuriae]|uniref:hypothetical protein n=1 Tax=Peribacillus loiseleuriae TaxID=1679170 RepID=UPI003D001817
MLHGERSGIKLHVDFTNETAMTLQIVETAGLKQDGPIGVTLKDKRFILVCDRVVPFTDYEGKEMRGKTSILYTIDFN